MRPTDIIYFGAENLIDNTRGYAPLEETGVVAQYILIKPPNKVVPNSME